MSENPNGNVKEAMPNTEVVTKAKRKRFTAAEKLRILREEVLKVDRTRLPADAQYKGCEKVVVQDVYRNPN